MKKKNLRSVSGTIWTLVSPHFPQHHYPQSTLLALNAILWILYNDQPWSKLPPRYGKWRTVYQRFLRWRDKGILENVLNRLSTSPGFDWLSQDRIRNKVRPRATSKRRRSEYVSQTEEERNAPFHFSMRSNMPVKISITPDIDPD